jgi:hypothetical protein
LHPIHWAEKAGRNPGVTSLTPGTHAADSISADIDSTGKISAGIVCWRVDS